MYAGDDGGVEEDEKEPFDGEIAGTGDGSVIGGNRLRG